MCFEIVGNSQIVGIRNVHKIHYVKSRFSERLCINSPFSGVTNCVSRSYSQSMKILRYPLFVFCLCLLTSVGSSQTLEHLHLAYASRVKNTPPSDVFASKNGIVRSLFGEPYRWDTINQLWQRLNDPYLGDSLDMESTVISPSGEIFDHLSNGWFTRSYDGGSTFSLFSAPRGNELMFSPDGELFILTGFWIARSDNDGVTWDSIHTPTVALNYFFDRAGNLLNFSNHEVYRLSRGAQSLDTIGTYPYWALVKVVCALDSNTIFVGSSEPDSLYEYREDSNTWRTIALPYPYASTSYGLCCDSSGDIFIGLEPDLMLSRDTGRTWQFLSSGDGGLVWMAYQAPSSLWLASFSHIMKYDITTKRLTGCDAPFEVLDTWLLSAKGDTIYAGAEDDSAFFRSTDDGDSWVQPLRDSNVVMLSGSTLQFSPDGATYLRTDMQLLKSYGGEAWRSVFPNSIELPVPNLAIDSASNLLLANSALSYDVSNDGGATWQGGGILFKPLYYPGVTSQGYFCSATDSIFEFSSDHGATWDTTRVDDTLARGWAFVHSAAGRIWLDYDSVVMLSTDGGQTWQRAMKGLSHAPKQDITTDPAGHTICIQGKWFQGLWWPDSCSIYAWDESTKSWSELMALPKAENLGSWDTSLFVYSLCANSKYLFLGTQSGVFRVAISDFNLAVSEPSSPPSEQSALAYPNPSSKNVSIRFYLEEPSPVSVTMYDVLGRDILRLSAGERGAGWNDIPISEALSPGTYSYRIEAGGQTFRGQLAIVSP